MRLSLLEHCSLEYNRLNHIFDSDTTVYSVKKLILNEDFNMLQPWGNANPKDNNAKEKLIQVYKTAVEMSMIVKGEFERRLTMCKGNYGRVLVNIKPMDSFIEKVIGRDGKNKDSGLIHDILRAAIIVKDGFGYEDVVQRIKQNFKVVELDHKSDPSQNALGYFGSYHFKVALPMNRNKTMSVICEIQLMSEKLWRYKDVGHQLYEPLRAGSSSDFDDDAKKYLASLSKLIFKFGNS